VKISGFSFARNAQKYDYPITESILSVLPICDEFIIAIGKGDKDDKTRDLVLSINSNKIKVIDTVWKNRETLKGAIYSEQTNIALSYCTGDFCFYIQADEVLHEKYLDIVYKRCEQFLNNKNVEGLLFDYKHFYGDYNHIQDGHGWYKYEIRIIRNNIGISSFGDAQSFRKHGKKLKVVKANAEIFHYGYVRNPFLMQNRNLEVETTYHGEETAKKTIQKKGDFFDFGSLDKLTLFTQTHPKVMERRIKEMNWSHLLKSNSTKSNQKLKHRILTWIEKKFFRGKHIGAYKNYILIKEK
jgi:glycosyltransferase involved in cell wall biosynthesis